MLMLLLFMLFMVTSTFKRPFSLLAPFFIHFFRDDTDFPKRPPSLVSSSSSLLLELDSLGLLSFFLVSDLVLDFETGAS